MVRQIIQLKQAEFSFDFPQHYVGKTIEIIAFPIEENEEDIKTKKAKLIARLREMKTDMTGYKFDRDEANER